MTGLKKIKWLGPMAVFLLPFCASAWLGRDNQTYPDPISMTKSGQLAKFDMKSSKTGKFFKSGEAGNFLKTKNEINNQEIVKICQKYNVNKKDLLNNLKSYASHPFFNISGQRLVSQGASCALSATFGNEIKSEKHCLVLLNTHKSKENILSEPLINAEILSLSPQDKPFDFVSTTIGGKQYDLLSYYGDQTKKLSLDKIYQIMESLIDELRLSELGALEICTHNLVVSIDKNKNDFSIQLKAPNKNLSNNNALKRSDAFIKEQKCLDHKMMAILQIIKKYLQDKSVNDMKSRRPLNQPSLLKKNKS